MKNVFLLPINSEKFDESLKTHTHIRIRGSEKYFSTIGERGKIVWVDVISSFSVLTDDRNFHPAPRCETVMWQF